MLCRQLCQQWRRRPDRRVVCRARDVRGFRAGGVGGGVARAAGVRLAPTLASTTRLSLPRNNPGERRARRESLVDQVEIGAALCAGGRDGGTPRQVTAGVGIEPSPVLAARVMPRADRPNMLTRGMDRIIGGLERGYGRILDWLIARPVPILAVTAHAVGESRDLCLLAGMDEYITKPIRLEALRRTLEKRTG